MNWAGKKERQCSFPVNHKHNAVLHNSPSKIEKIGQRIRKGNADFSLALTHTCTYINLHYNNHIITTLSTYHHNDEISSNY